MTTPLAWDELGAPRFGLASLRPYPRNSPQAAARLVALAMLADGRLQQEEFIALERHDAWRRLDIAREEWNAVLLDLWEDLVSCTVGQAAPSCEVEAWVLDQLLADIDDPALRRTVLSLCVSVVESDEQVQDAEALLLTRTVEQWGLQRECLAAVTPAPMALAA